MEIIAKKISKKSLFKIITIGFTIGISFFAILFGIAAFFGAETVEWNGVHKTGIQGFMYSLVIGPIWGFLTACIIWLFTVFGLWVYSFFKPIKITFKYPVEQRANVV